MKRTWTVAVVALLGAAWLPAVASAGAKVRVRPDIVYLRDGTQLTGTVLIEGAKAVILLTKEGEQAVPTENIERVLRKPGLKVANYATTVKDGHIEIVPVEVKETEGSGPASPKPDMSVDVKKPGTSTTNTTRPRGAGTATTKPAGMSDKQAELLKKLLEAAKKKDLLKEFEANR